MKDETTVTDGSGSSGELAGTGLLLVQLSASGEGSGGTVVVDIRRAGGSGGSLRAGRTSVSFDSNVQHSHLTMPFHGEEEYIINMEGISAVPPVYSFQKIAFP